MRIELKKEEKKNSRRIACASDVAESWSKQFYAGDKMNG